MSAVSNDQLLSRKQAAEFLGLQPQTLATWASKKRNALPYVKVGGRVRYRMSDLQRWLENNTRVA